MIGSEISYFFSKVLLLITKDGVQNNCKLYNYAVHPFDSVRVVSIKIRKYYEASEKLLFVSC